MDRIVIVSDQQARYDDRRSEAAVLEFIRDFQPQTIVDAGDLVDFQALSRFRTTLEDKQSIMQDINAGRKILVRQREAAPDARLVVIAGNHEERLSKYLLDTAPELWNVPGLDVPTLLGLSERDVRAEYVGPNGAGIQWHGVLIYHGDKVRSQSGYSARAELEEAGTSGVSGHTQRLGSHYKTDRSGPHAWYENGCLCRIDPDGAPPSMRGPRPNNWQQGFTFGEADETGWNLYQVAIHRHRFRWNGKLYSG